MGKCFFSPNIKIICGTDFSVKDVLQYPQEQLHKNKNWSYVAIFCIPCHEHLWTYISVKSYFLGVERYSHITQVSLYILERSRDYRDLERLIIVVAVGQLSQISL